MEFIKERSHSSQVFPFPQNGDVVWETPPCLIWLMQEGFDGKYSVSIRKNSAIVWTGETEYNYIVPDIIFEPGEYEWNVCAGECERGWISFTIADGAVEFLRPTGKQIFDAVPETVRPRHLFFKNDIAQLIEQHTEDIETLKRNIEQAYKDGIPEPPRFASDPDAMPPRKYIGYHRLNIDRNMVACSLGFHLLGDEKAGEFAKKLLLEVSSWDPYVEASPKAVTGYDEIGLSFARTLPSVFDMLYELLTETERKTVINTIVAYASQCEEVLVERNFVANPGFSHSGRMPAYVGEAAMVLKGTGVDEAMLVRWLNLASEIYGGIFPFYGGHDGSWSEGPFYASSYTKWYLPFFNAVDRYIGVSYLDRPFYQRLTKYMLHFNDENAEIHPFGDGYWCRSDDDEWPGFFAQNPYRVYADKFGPEEAIITASKIKQPELFLLHLLDIFLPSGKAPKQHITGKAENTAVFKDAGYVSMRSSLIENNGCMAVMARASRHGSASHSHPDQGSFALFYEGTALICPSGYYGKGYDSDHHLYWTNETKAHNCILVDGKGQKKRSHEPVGRIDSCLREDNIYTAVLNLSDAYEDLAEWKRELIMDSERKVLTVRDTVISDKEVELDWLLHSLSEPCDEGKGKVSLKRNGISLEILPKSGLIENVKIKDKFDVDVEHGAPSWYHSTMPKQYHIAYKTEKRKEHRIEVELRITPDKDKNID